MNAAQDIRNITPQDLAVLGLQDMAYLRSVTYEGTDGYGIFTADGTQVAFAPTRALAEAAVRQHELEPVSVH
ncbi:MAG: hypothetical protein QOK29_4583 [Rhodospirillaceae bacterium]|jgi:hypothetical protein|nr:hypothetical protein [Rhodospirillaceae bacterium]